NGGPISGATGASHDPVMDGDYSVVVTDANGCTNQSLSMPYSGASVGEYENTWFSIYPNPFMNTLSIAVKNNCTVEIRNSLGQLVLSTAASKTVQTGEWETGVYSVTATTFRGIQSFKLVKAR
ncbi:MAG TPA: T9SS type A sorting domain-containing protein, partial [Flavobacteriales bacterium]|nr:T9SS type A sorting domain-containing protein [Flavobacteriales bacterium]